MVVSALAHSPAVTSPPWPPGLLNGTPSQAQGLSRGRTGTSLAQLLSPYGSAPHPHPAMASWVLLPVPEAYGVPVEKVISFRQEHWSVMGYSVFLRKTKVQINT